MQDPPGPPEGGLFQEIRVIRGDPGIPRLARRVFHAPYVEEINGVRYQKNPEFWSIWKDKEDLYITTVFPEGSGHKKAVLKFSLESSYWYLYINTKSGKADPFEYPLDGLILYYLTVISKDIMIHASGINHNGKGYLFSGVSGHGKSTLAHIWKDAGAKVIHDDRLIIRYNGEQYKMYNTPVYDNEEPGESMLDNIYLIGHGKQNRSVQLNGASAVSLVVANCIQQNWGTSIISGLLGSVATMCGKIPVYALDFVPDKTVVDHILKIFNSNNVPHAGHP